MAPETREHSPAGLNCAEVARELAVPTGRFEPSLLADHVASCSNCAAASTRAERLDQILAQTRPDEPAGGFDALWARVCMALDSPSSSRTLPFSEARRLRRRRVLAVAGLAQAAVLLLAALLVFNRVDRPRQVGTDRDKVVPVARVDIEEGQPVMIEVGDHQVNKVVNLDPVELEPSISVAFDFEMLNKFESMAQ